MAKIMRTQRAGPLEIVTVYPSLSRWDSDAVRRAKRKQCTLAKQHSNDKRMFLRVELLLAANFAEGDLFVTLTFDEQHLPRNREGCRKAARKFHANMRAARRARGQPYRYLYVMEHKHGDGRWHLHLVLNAAGEDYNDLRAAWAGGRVEEFRPIRIDRDHTWEALARYLTKEARDCTDQNVYSTSRGLVKPEVDFRRIPNDENAEPPPGAWLLFDSGPVRTAYGEFRVLKYMFRPDVPRRKAGRRKRKAKKRTFI